MTFEFQQTFQEKSLAPKLKTESVSRHRPKNDSFV